MLLCGIWGASNSLIGAPRITNMKGYKVKHPYKYLVYVERNGVMREWYEFSSLDDANTQFGREVQYWSGSINVGLEVTMYRKTDESGSIPDVLKKWEWTSDLYVQPKEEDYDLYDTKGSEL